MTLEQLIVRLDRQRLRYAFVLADLRAAGEVIYDATADQILLAELAGCVVNLRTGQVTRIPGYSPPWLDDLIREPATSLQVQTSEMQQDGDRKQVQEEGNGI
jgi:hypothetical protein